MENQLNYKPIFTFAYYNRSLALTREGAGFIILVFSIGLGAINTGNNLLYLILAMCCSFIAVSGVLSEFSLKDIHIEGQASKSMYAGEPYALTLKISNRKRRITSYSLRIDLSGDRSSRYQVDRDLYVFQGVQPA